MGHSYGLLFFGRTACNLKHVESWGFAWEDVDYDRLWPI